MSEHQQLHGARFKQAYPADWKRFSRKIRYERAQGRCECVGECGLHATHPGPRRCTEIDGQPAEFAKGIVRLTVAHLCNCSPPCAVEQHVKALCNRCHLRVDVELHKQHRIRNQRLRREKAGQLRFKGDDHDNPPEEGREREAP